MIRESRHADPHVTAGSVPDLTLGTVTVACPGCGTPASVQPGERRAVDFCRQCDEPLFWAGGAVPRRESVLTDDARRRLPGTGGHGRTTGVPCPACAELNTTLASVCARCGSSMTPPEPAAPAPVAVPVPVVVVPEPVPEPEKVSWWPILVALTVVGAVCLGIGLWL
ncbi:hypothetical protein [Sanguibacter sp. HDW7]|uniref:hypothetical protein n=1 Tax=Sanguibacter sp. HDW7 TaxID=2714931 RepID=UPI0014094DF3|nr:hypothetical protein [Sanguibacter sp. HDW7]QIK83056.1 hypothetical protein G7063_05000 [Sanguibacter sp. HDW7]